MSLKILKSDRALIYALRGHVLTRNDPIPVFKLSHEEEDLIRHWYQKMELAKDLEETFKEFSDSGLVRYLTLRSGLSFPLPLAVLTDKKRRLRIIGYYLMKDALVLPPSLSFTDQQQSVIHLESGLLCVNAGPGTGKTTTATERAYRLWRKGERVVIISYANSTIHENYQRFYNYPGLIRGNTKFFGKKDKDKAINIITVDSLAYQIYPVLGVDYDHSIANAIDHLITYHPSFDHLIVDEAQDIDDLRGNLIMNLYYSGGIKSLVIFGDPRQRIHHRAGGWFCELWATRSCQCVELTQTHRFVNSGMLDLVNSLSAQRPQYHVSLHSDRIIQSEIPIEVWSYSDGNDSCFLELGKYIQSLHQQGWTYSDIALLTPSLERTNATSRLAGKVMAVFQELQIPLLSYKAEKSFVANGVYTGTIHSAKGREFRLVILCGIHGYPQNWPIGYEEGESLTYVAHSRAQERMIYLVPERLEIPRGVNKNFLRFKDSIPLMETEINFHGIYRTPISDLSSCQNFQILFKVNGYSLMGQKTQSGPTLPSCPKMDPKYWGTLTGMGVQMFLTNKYPDVILKVVKREFRYLNTKKYQQYVREGRIHQGWDLETDELVIIGEDDDVNILREQELERLKEITQKKISELTWEDWKHLTLVLNFCMEGNMISRCRLSEVVFTDDINLYLQRIANYLKLRFGEDVQAEYPVKNPFVVGFSDLKFSQAVIELKASSTINESHRIQGYTYASILELPGYVYNMQTGEIQEVICPRGRMSFRYLIEGYGMIKNSMYHVENKKKPIRGYAVDTEFTRFDQRIFEIALVNLEDPYRSIMGTIRIEELGDAISWMKDYRPYWSEEQLGQLLLESLTENEIRKMIQHEITLQTRTRNVRVEYYGAKKDLELLPGEMECHNLTLAGKKLGSEVGISLSTNAPPSLVDLYETFQGPVELTGYLYPHTAISDALILYEMLALGWLDPEMGSTEMSNASIYKKEIRDLINDVSILTIGNVGLSRS